jgi:DNA-binding FadR family transcriptional regulator
LAAQRAGEEDIQELQESVYNLRISQGDPEKWIESDLHFHSLIAKASKNPYAEVFIEIILQHMDFLVGSGFLLEGVIEETIAMHEDVFKHIKDGNPVKASEKMRAHILLSKDRMAKTLRTLHKD